MSIMDKCREAFERHQADLTDTDYEVLKHHFDNNEQYFGSRYNEGSLYERDWFVWEACWQSRQAELNQLNEVLDGRTKEWLEAIELGTYFQDVAKPLKDEVEQLQLQINEMAEVGLSQESAIREKDKRIKELENRIEEGLGFIDKFHCEGWLSDLDNAEKALRGEHE